MLELTFAGQVEADPLPDLSPGRAYVAGDPFFDLQEYQMLSKPLAGSNEPLHSLR
ncbi:MAG: hypothetical protein Q6K80_00745 [Thermostichus sp. DG_1_6_bins_120]